MSNVYDINGNVVLSGSGALADISRFHTTESSPSEYDYIVKSIAHRGYCTAAPENTLPAYTLAKTNGFYYVETDVVFTSDEIPVLLHDSTINRTARNSDGTEIETTIAIKDITYAEALEYDFGIWKDAEYAGTKIPTFEEFIRLTKYLGLHPYIELKTSEVNSSARAEALAKIVRKHDMLRRCTWIASNTQKLQWVVDADPFARVGYLWTPSETEITKLKALRTGYNEVFFDTSYGAITDELIDLCAAENIPVELWTIVSNSTVLDASPYVSGFTTNGINAGKVLFDKNNS